MKSFKTVATILIVAFTFTAPAFGQTDSVETSPKIDQRQSAAENLKAETQLNEDRQDNAKAVRKEYKAKAKDARRVEKDASDASRQARKSVKMEKQARKARENAEKQNRKTQKATDKSDNN